MNTIERDAPAKINWFLEVLHKREDGYHELVTVMQRIDWCDHLRFTQRDDGKLALTCSDPTLPTDEHNLVMRAAQALKASAPPERTEELGADIHLEKNIPHGSGLGGGSSDAATTLMALNDLWNLKYLKTKLDEIAGTIGSDINFFLADSPLALCEGRGERVTPLPKSESKSLIIVWPGILVSTEKIFQSGLIDLRAQRLICNFSDAVGGFGTGITFNRLQRPCEILYSSVREALEAVQKIAGERAVTLSGSGSAFFVVCKDRGDAETLASRIPPHFKTPAIVKVTATRA